MTEETTPLKNIRSVKPPPPPSKEVIEVVRKEISPSLTNSFNRCRTIDNPSPSVFAEGTDTKCSHFAVLFSNEREPLIASNHVCHSSLNGLENVGHVANFIEPDAHSTTKEFHRWLFRESYFSPFFHRVGNTVISPVGKLFAPFHHALNLLTRLHIEKPCAVKSWNILVEAGVDPYVALGMVDSSRAFETFDEDLPIAGDTYHHCWVYKHTLETLAKLKKGVFHIPETLNETIVYNYFGLSIVLEGQYYTRKTCWASDNRFKWRLDDLSSTPSQTPNPFKVNKKEIFLTMKRLFRNGIQSLNEVVSEVEATLGPSEND